MSDLVWKYIFSSAKKKFFFTEIFTEIVLISTFERFSKFFFYSLKKDPLKNIILSHDFNFPESFSNNNSSFIDFREVNFFNDIFKLMIQKFFFIFVSSFPFLLKKECDFEYLLTSNILNFLKVEKHSIRCCSFIFYSFLINSCLNLPKFKSWSIKKKKFLNKIKKLLIFNSSKEVSIFGAINLKKIKSKIDITRNFFLIDKKNNFFSCVPQVNLSYIIKKIKKNLKIFRFENKKFIKFKYFKKIFILNYINKFRTLLIEPFLNKTTKKKKESNILKNKNNIRIFKEIVCFISIKFILWFLEKDFKNYFIVFFFIQKFFSYCDFIKNFFFVKLETIVSIDLSHNLFIKIFGLTELSTTILSNLPSHFKIKDILQLLSLRVKIKMIKFKKEKAFLNTFLNKFLACVFLSSNMVYKKVRPIFKDFNALLVFRVLVLNKKTSLTSTNKPLFNKFAVKISYSKISRLLKKIPIQILPDLYLNYLKLFVCSNLNFQKKFNNELFLSKNELLKSFVSHLFLILKKAKTSEYPILLLFTCFGIIKSYQFDLSSHLIFINKISERISKKNCLATRIKINLELNISHRTQKIPLKLNIISRRNQLYYFNINNKSPFSLLSTLSLIFQIKKKKKSIDSVKLFIQPIRKIECMGVGFLFFKESRKKLKPDSIGKQVQTLVKYFKNVKLNKIPILETKDNTIFKNNFKLKKMTGILIKKQLEGRDIFLLNNEFSLNENKYQPRFKNIFINRLKKTKDIFIFQKEKSTLKKKRENMLNLIITLPTKTTLDLIRF